MSNTIIKSGAWNEDASDCRSAYFVDWPLAARADYTGFRLALTTDSVHPRRTIRSGSWIGPWLYMRSACRGLSEPGDRDRLIGFRLALTASIEP